jgi:hypothetical protein
VYDQFLFNFDQGTALLHCVNLSHKQLKADWVIDFDVDEVFAFNEVMGGSKPEYL